MGKSSTRLEVLRLLKQRGGQSAGALAAALGVSTVAVRKHLDALVREGAVTTELVRQPIGRPVYRYHLTERAAAYFPQGHRALLLDLLAALDRLDPALLERAVALCNGQLRERYAAQLGDKPLPERVAELARLRDADGYVVTVHQDGDCLLLQEHHCPIRDVAERYPVACRCEQELFRTLLGDGVEYAGSLLHGQPACAYRIPLTPAPPTG